MLPIDITAHPDMPGVTRRAVVLSVNNDLQARVITVVLEIQHFTGDGQPHAYLQPVRKLLRATDTNYIDPATGQAVEPGTPGAVAEYQAMEAQLGSTYFGLIALGVANADARGSFNQVLV